MIVAGREVVQLVELRGVYDGWSVALLDDGTAWNRWGDETQQQPIHPDYRRRWETTQAFLRGEPANGRWFE